jgi:tetratricopeptide (TPR) repeat protein
MVLGDIRAADARLEATAALVEELRQPTQRRALDVARTMRALFAGRFQEAEKLIKDALDAGPGTRGLEVEWFWVVRVQAWALAREHGRLRELRPDIERLVDEYPLVPYLQPLLATLYSELGCEAEARQKLEALARRDFADLIESDWLPQVCLLSQVCALLGDTRHAANLYEPLLPYAQCNVLAYPELSLGSASRYLGLLASTLSRWTDAARHFEAAIEMHAEMGARPWVAHTQHDYANMLLARDEASDRERARELIAEALTTYRDLGMDGWTEAASEFERVLQRASAPAQ